MQVFDCMGELVNERKLMMKKGAVVIDVAASGLVQLNKQNTDKVDITESHNSIYQCHRCSIKH